MKKATNISVIGLGKLGLTMSACFASKGYRVIGVDIDKNKIESINRGENPIKETGLTQLIKKSGGNIKVTTDYKEAILNSELTFIVVATPSEADGSFSNEQLEGALKQIGAALKVKDRYHLVVITSTVMPDTTEHVGKFILEDISGKICGKDFGLAYNPEFIALGSIIHDFLNPDFILIGEVNEKDGEILEEIYKDTCDNNPRFARMNPVSAEIAKISLNCYITMKITYANSLAAICEKVPGADAAVITNGIGMDSRIGQKYLKPGLGYGGPCFPRDNVAFAAFARKVGEKAKLAEMVDEVNRNQVERIENKIKERIIKLKKKKEEVTIGIVGLSYKPNTPIIEDSQAIDIVDKLVSEGYKVVVHDPQAQEYAKGVFGNKVNYASTGNACAAQADMLITTTPWEEYKKIELKKDIYVIDCWKMFEDRNLGEDKIEFIGKGKKSKKGEQ